MLRTALVILVATSALAGGACARPLDQYLEEASGYQRAGDADQAYAVMEAALAEYPDNATVYAHLGIYRGMQAGQAQNVVQASSLSNEAFVLLDRAVGLDSLNAYARLYRGLMGVKVPQWLGKLGGALADLEWVPVIAERSPGTVPADLLVLAHSLLGEGYQKQGDAARARSAWAKVIDLAPGSASARTAEEQLAKIKQDEETQATGGAPPGPPPVSADPAQVAALMERGTALMNAEDYAAAERTFREVILLDPSNAAAYRLAATAMVNADRGYDQRIAEDTNTRTNMVFEAMRLLDKSVDLDPGNLETRLMRGIMGIQFPFFVNKLDQGIQDLETIVNAAGSTAFKAEAEYWLGFGYQKKGMTYWTKVVNENLDQDAVRLALGSMRPAISRFDRKSHPGPVVVVEFLLGFRDDLPPQTAAWIETEKGELVKTLYVSDFSGKAKQVQVVLPVYAAETGYADADAATGASIDVGNHIYLWDLKDSAGNQVAPGRYTVKVEVSWWPTMKYQMAEAALEIGPGPASQVIEQGDYLPYFRVEYLP